MKRVIILMNLSKPEWAAKPGGVAFIDCLVEDARDRPAVIAESPVGFFDVTGSLTVRNPHGVRTVGLDGEVLLEVSESGVVER